MSAQHAFDFSGLREARCPQCAHAGMISRSLPMSKKLKCRSCGTVAEIRCCIGGRPARFHDRTTKKQTRDAIARGIIERFGSPSLDDPVADLWIGGNRE